MSCPLLLEKKSPNKLFVGGFMKEQRKHTAGTTVKFIHMASKPSPGFGGINQVREDVISKIEKNNRVRLHTQYERSRLSGFRVVHFFKDFP